MVVKDIENDEPYAGSVSIPRSILQGSGMDEEFRLNHAYQMWITLFDDQNDDEYDGALGIQDDEVPRVLIEITISEQVVKAPPKTVKPPVEAQSRNEEEFK